MAVITVLENRATAVLEEYWEFSIICIELVRVHIFCVNFNPKMLTFLVSQCLVITGINKPNNQRERRKPDKVHCEDLKQLFGATSQPCHLCEEFQNVLMPELTNKKA